MIVIPTTPTSLFAFINQTQSDSFVPTDSSNTPMGTAKGIYPGRVVWSHNPNATSWNGISDYYWEEAYTNTDTVELMLAASIQKLTGVSSSINMAWDSLFRYFNSTHSKGNIGYQSGEKIAIKIVSNNTIANALNVSPQMALAMTRQLVNNAGVSPSDITFYEVTTSIPDEIANKCWSEYPTVHFVDSGVVTGHEKFETDSSVEVKWSQDLTLEDGGGNTTFLPKCLTHASYLINISLMKGHDLASVTLTAKNHIGTIIARNTTHPEYQHPIAAGVHPYLTAQDMYAGPGSHWNFTERPMGSYNCLVDLMGHEHIGNKTLLYVIDALYACNRQVGSGAIPVKWDMPPFNNDWTSSIFSSLDGVAIESVGLDFLRSEPNIDNVNGTADNYLHEAAKADNPVSGTTYDPEDDGNALQSLGVHEHWNNYDDKQYTRNLGSGIGIELVKISKNASSIHDKLIIEDDVKINAYPNPVHDILSIESNIFDGETIPVIIFNAKGNPVFETEANVNTVFKIDVSHLKSGTYFLKIEKHQITFVKR